MKVPEVRFYLKEMNRIQMEEGETNLIVVASAFNDPNSLLEEFRFAKLSKKEQREIKLKKIAAENARLDVLHN